MLAAQARLGRVFHSVLIHSCLRCNCESNYTQKLIRELLSKCDACGVHTRWQKKAPEQETVVAALQTKDWTKSANRP